MRIIFVLALALVFFSCNNNNEQNEDQQQPANLSTDTLPYYDISAEVLNEITGIKNLPKAFIYKITEQNGKKDSVGIDTTEFMRLATPFYELKLNDPQIKKEYKESVFADNDTKSYVLNYKTSNEKLPVKSVSVMLDNQKQEFKRADLTRYYQKNDTLYEERLAWTPGKRFQIIQIITSGNSELTKQTYVYWRERK